MSRARDATDIDPLPLTHLSLCWQNMDDLNTEGRLSQIRYHILAAVVSVSITLCRLLLCSTYSIIKMEKIHSRCCGLLASSERLMIFPFFTFLFRPEICEYLDIGQLICLQFLKLIWIDLVFVFIDHFFLNFFLCFSEYALIPSSLIWRIAFKDVPSLSLWSVNGLDIFNALRPYQSKRSGVKDNRQCPECHPWHAHQRWTHCSFTSMIFTSFVCVCVCFLVLCNTQT